MSPEKTQPWLKCHYKLISTKKLGGIVAKFLNGDFAERHELPHPTCYVLNITIMVFLKV